MAFWAGPIPPGVVYMIGQCRASQRAVTMGNLTDDTLDAGIDGRGLAKNALAVLAQGKQACDAFFGSELYWVF